MDSLLLIEWGTDLSRVVQVQKILLTVARASLKHKSSLSLETSLESIIYIGWAPALRKIRSLSNGVCPESIFFTWHSGHKFHFIGEAMRFELSYDSIVLNIDVSIFYFELRSDLQEINWDVLPHIIFDSIVGPLIEDLGGNIKCIVLHCDLSSIKVEVSFEIDWGDDEVGPIKYVGAEDSKVSDNSTNHAQSHKNPKEGLESFVAVTVEGNFVSITIQLFDSF